MPLFFFNHTSANGVSVDEAGTEFPSLEAAYLDTCHAILDIAFEKLQARQDPAADVFEIVGERGDILLVIPFSEVLQPQGPKKPPKNALDDSPMATSFRLKARHRVLKATLHEEFRRTEFEFRAVKANMARLDAACSADWTE